LKGLEYAISDLPGLFHRDRNAPEETSLLPQWLASAKGAYISFQSLMILGLAGVGFMA
jgi:hypothetical protein